MGTTTAHKDTIVSIIGSQYFQPIADLLGAFLKRTPPKSDAVNAGYYEGAYVVSIILLLVAAVESVAARDRYFNKKPAARKHIAVPEYMKEMYGYRGYARLSELYVIRDAIFHNHVWVLDFLAYESGNRQLLSANRISWSGNDRLTQRLKSGTRRTKLLGLNAIPSQMDRRDLLKVFDVAISALHFFERRGANPVHVLRGTVGFQGVRTPFAELRERLANALSQPLQPDWPFRCRSKASRLSFR
jgi:hypothetical protein